MTRPTFGTPSPRRHRSRPVHPGQTTLVLLTLIRGDGGSLQVLEGGMAAPEFVAPVALARRAA
jgi:hypothetical protein